VSRINEIWFNRLISVDSTVVLYIIELVLVMKIAEILLVGVKTQVNHSIIMYVCGNDIN
jgi:hypothetical protein